MNDCDKFENGIQDIIAGSPRFEQLEAVVEHCKTCRECRELFDLHQTLGNLGSRFDEMEDVNLDEVRSQIIGKVIATGRRRSSWSRMLALWNPFTLRSLAATALLAVVFISGFVASRMGGRSPLPVREMSDEVFINASLRNIKDSPYALSNVAVKELNGDKVTLVFDVSKRVEIVQPMHSELVKGILTHSLVSPYATGAIGHFQNIPSRNRSFY
jgi:hypothetical protein